MAAWFEELFAPTFPIEQSMALDEGKGGQAVASTQDQDKIINDEILASSSFVDDAEVLTTAEESVGDDAVKPFDPAQFITVDMLHEVIAFPQFYLLHSRLLSFINQKTQ